MEKLSIEVQDYANMIADAFIVRRVFGMDVSRFKFEEDITEHRGYCRTAATLNSNGDQLAQVI